jgi:hypothetical protein
LGLAKKRLYSENCGIGRRKSSRIKKKPIWDLKMSGGIGREALLSRSQFDTLINIVPPMPLLKSYERKVMDFLKLVPKIVILRLLPELDQQENQQNLSDE